LLQVLFLQEGKHMSDIPASRLRADRRRVKAVFDCYRLLQVADVALRCGEARAAKVAVGEALIALNTYRVPTDL
jgi:hypothetical protein